MKPYKKIEDSFAKKRVQASLLAYPLKFVQSNGDTIYTLGKLRIIERTSLDNEFYPLSTKEVLNVADYYGLLDKLNEIVINNYRLRNLNGFDDETYTATHGASLTLFKPIILLDRKNEGIWKWRENFPERWQALFTLLHEIGHILGYNKHDGSDIEAKANDFAKSQIDKFWKVLIKE